MAYSTNIVFDDKADTNSNSSTLNQNGIVYHTLNKTITIIFMIKDYDANVNKINRTDQIAYELSNFDLIIAVISGSDIIVRETKTSIAIYSIICG